MSAGPHIFQCSIFQHNIFQNTCGGTVSSGRVPLAWKREWILQQARLEAIHNAAVRLGTVGGIASGKSRRA